MLQSGGLPGGHRLHSVVRLSRFQHLAVKQNVEGEHHIGQEKATWYLSIFSPQFPQTSKRTINKKQSPHMLESYPVRVPLNQRFHPWSVHRAFVCCWTVHIAFQDQQMASLPVLRPYQVDCRNRERLQNCLRHVFLRSSRYSIRCHTTQSCQHSPSAAMNKNFCVSCERRLLSVSKRYAPGLKSPPTTHPIKIHTPGAKHRSKRPPRRVLISMWGTATHQRQLHGRHS